MLMFSRNSGAGARTRDRDKTDNCAASPCRFSVNLNNVNNNNNSGEQGEAAGSMFSRAAGDKRDSRASVKKSRPHSWHSTIQKGLARARSRSSGREKERDKAKRASSALNPGQSGDNEEGFEEVPVLNEHVSTERQKRGDSSVNGDNITILAAA